MGMKLLGRIGWDVKLDENGFRDYTIKWLLESNTLADGPFLALNCAGLPGIGTPWIFGNDNDPFCYCTPQWTVSQAVSNDPSFALWIVSQPFTNKPLSSNSNQQTNNPLAQPAAISGSFVKYTEVATRDKDGKMIRNSAWERFKGPEVEFDRNRPTVHIEQNFASLGLDIFSPMVDQVNDSSLWGAPKRCVKLSNVAWSRQVYGYGYYYTRAYDFDVDFNTFDRVVADYGTQRLVLVGGDKNNPKHFVPITDDTSGQRVTRPLDGNGNVATGEPAAITIKKYTEGNFLTLGIPTSLA